VVGLYVLIFEHQSYQTKQYFDFGEKAVIPLVIHADTSGQAHSALREFGIR
jgi:hypothetical protein